MKKMKMILAVAMLFTAFGVNAQTEKGKMLAGGNLGFSTSSGNEKYTYDNPDSLNVNGSIKQNGVTTIGINPSIGYFFIDNLAGGLKLNVNLTNSKSRVEGDKSASSVTELNVGPFVRYYYTMDKIAPFGEMFVGFGNRTDKDTAYDGTKTTSKVSGVSFAPGVGLAYFVNENIGIEGLINYTFQSSKVDITNGVRKTTTGKFGINIGLQVYL